MTISRSPACATLSVEEAAGVVGISRTSLYALVRSGCVPHLRFGRVIRIPRQSLDEWLCRLADASLRAGSEGIK
jgi:excisionase family DNA binding protein